MTARWIIWVMAIVCCVPMLWAADVLMRTDAQRMQETAISARISTLTAQKQSLNEQLTMALDTLKATAVDANAMVEESKAILSETQAVLDSQDRTLENKAAVIDVVSGAVDVNDVENKAQWVSFLQAVIEIAQQDLTK